MSQTPDRDALILAMLGEGKTQQAIADAIGVSRQRAAQLIAALKSKTPPAPDAPLNLYASPLQALADPAPLGTVTQEDHFLYRDALARGSEEAPNWAAAMNADRVRNRVKTMKARMRLIAAGELPPPPTIPSDDAVPTHRLASDAIARAADVLQWGDSHKPEFDRAYAALVERYNTTIDPLAAYMLTAVDRLSAGVLHVMRERDLHAKTYATMQQVSRHHADTEPETDTPKHNPPLLDVDAQLGKW